jgi:methyl-accepting chemotaxis protein
MQMTIKDISVRAKIWISILITGTVIGVVACTAFIINDKILFEQSLVKNAKVTADIIGANVSPAIEFLDQDSALEILSSLHRNPRVEAALLFDSEATLFAKYQRADVKQNISVEHQESGYTLTAKFLGLYREVKVDDSVIGYLYLRFDLVDLYDRIERDLYISAAVSLLLFLLSALLASITYALIGKPVKRVEGALKEIAEGQADLTIRLPVNRKDELGKVSASFNQFVERIQGIVRSIIDVSDEIVVATTQLQVVVDETNKEMNNQKGETEQVASAIHEMSTTVKAVAVNAESTSLATSEADSQSLEGQSVVEQVISDVQDLSKDFACSAKQIYQLRNRSEEINKVVDMISKIAETTNLLALNAAIESARAGEAGKGFSVVADEIRHLAQSTQQATQSIRDIVSQLQLEASSSVESIDQGQKQLESCVEQATRAGESLGLITSSVNTINDMNIQVASAVEQQSTVFDHIDQSVTSISTSIQGTCKQVDITSEEIRHFNTLSARLDELISQCTV